MPIYEYHCNHCSTEIEVFHRTMSSAGEGATCDHCGSTDLTRKFSVAGVSMGPGGSGYSTAAPDNSCSTPGGGCWGGSCGLS
ncbi:MAG: zinc ribbon domain-containing protein [Bacteroidetes bacterium]|nr:zinc ribbon domain-containing protein [Bacteroidota bacterium]